MSSGLCIPFDFLNGDFDEENNFMSLIGKLLGKPVLISKVRI